MARLFFKPERQWDFSYYLWILIIASITFGFKGESFCQESHWTIMIYMAGDDTKLRGRLEGRSYGKKDLNEMEEAMEGVTANVIVLLDEYPESAGQGGETKAYKVDYDSAPEETDQWWNIVSEEIPLTDINPSWGDELNMGDPQTLIDFATWAIQTYPADKYALILWGHGTGWAPPPEEAVGEPTKSVCNDQTDDDWLNVAELRTAIQTIYNLL